MKKEKTTNRALSTKETSVKKEAAPDASGKRKSTTQVKGGVDALTTNNVEEESEWYPVIHPKLPLANPPRYLVNKQAAVRSTVRGNYKIMTRTTDVRPCYKLTWREKRTSRYKLDEIMAYTFWEQAFDSSVHYIYHKDGDTRNCAWDNLLICDLSSLQQMEITRLEKLHPGTKYTVVRNVHDTLTYERYLVSDAGIIYSLINRRHLGTSDHPCGFDKADIYSDTNATQTTNKRLPTLLHRIVMHSFNGPCSNKSHYITHKNGDKRDNSLKNLAYLSASESVIRAIQRKRQAPRGRRKAQESTPKREIRPMPPITKETQWMTIGVLPWNGRSFSNYEVSDAGHVRTAGDKVLLTMLCGAQGYIFVDMYRDDPNMEGDGVNTSKENRFKTSVSRLVANAFVDGYSEEQNVVKHLNGDKQDNHAENLRWLSRKSSLLYGSESRVVATLDDNSESQKDFATLVEARKVLGLASKTLKRGKTIQKMVNWNGDRRIATIQVF